MEKIKITLNLPIKKNLLVLYDEELQQFYLNSRLQKDNFLPLDILIIRILEKKFSPDQIEYVYNHDSLDKYFLKLSDQMRGWLQFPEDDFFFCNGWLPLLCSLRLKNHDRLHFCEELPLLYHFYNLKTVSYFFDFISPYLDAAENQILGGFEFSDPLKKKLIIFKDGLIHGIAYTLKDVLKDKS